MSDDAKQVAWRRYCDQLEALGVDPLTPNGMHGATTDEQAIRRWWS